MPDLSRRTFLIRTSLGAAAAGAVAIPGFQALLPAVETEAPAAEDTTVAEADGTASVLSDAEPLVAHVKNLQTGEISLYMGEREVTVTNPGMAAQLFRAAR